MGAVEEEEEPGAGAGGGPAPLTEQWPHEGADRAGRRCGPRPERGARPPSVVPAPRKGPTWSPQSQTMLYIIWATQKQCRKLWKGLFL